MKQPIPDAAIEKHMAFVGKTGSGKTTAAKSIVERLLNDVRQVCVIDPTSAWWGLRLMADGKRQAFRNVVIIGGDRADVPLAPRSGQAVSQLVTEQRASVIVDTGGLTVGEYTQWFTEFANALYRNIKAPLHLVIDEAHQFMPQQKVPDPQAGKMLHAGNRLMSGGRSRGIRAMLITQRPAKLHKDALTCAETLVAMRVIAPQDRQAVKDWIDGCGDPAQGKQVVDSLAQLPVGEAWVWFPEGGHLERAKFPKIATYDSSAAPTHGAKDAPRPGEIDLTAVRSALADAVKEAEANDPRKLRAENARLEAELRKAQKAKPGAPSTAPAGVPRKTVEQVVRVVRKALDRSTSALTDAALAITKASDFRFVIQQLEFLAGVSDGPAVEVETARSPLRGVHPLAPAIASMSRVGKSSGDRRMLIALAQRPQGMSDSQLGARAGISSRSGTFGNYLARLRTNGHIDGTRERLTITAAGLEALGDYEPLPTGAALVEYWCGELGGGAARMLRALADAYPSSLSDEELGQRAEISAKSGTFGNYLARLRTLELASGSRAAIVMSEELA